MINCDDEFGFASAHISLNSLAKDFKTKAN